MIKNISSTLAFVRSPNGRLLVAAIGGFVLGYGIKSANSTYAITTSQAGTYRMDTISGKTWSLSMSDGRVHWSRVGEP